MIRPVFLLLSILLVQGRGCDHFMENLFISREKQRGEFRTVFPKDYKITHHYNDNLSCGSDSCCMLREAYMLSDAWSHLLVQLWKVNLKYDFILQLKDKLDTVTKEKFLESPDPNVFPSVPSTPEALLNFTTSFFSRWLEQKCPLVERCEFPLPPSFKEEGKKNTPAPFTNQGRVEGGKIQKQHSGAPQTNLATATHLSVPYIFWCFPLLWTVL